MNNNISELYKISQTLAKQAVAEAAKTEKHLVSNSILNTLRDSFQKILEFEKTYLILAMDSFYGLVLMKVETQIDFTLNAPVGSEFSHDIIILNFNPIRCLANYNFSEFTGAIIGEILKIVSNHPQDYATLNAVKDDNLHEMLEKASDATVSEIIRKDINLYNGESAALRVPKDMYTVSQMNDELQITPKRDSTLEYYFEALKRFSKKRPQGDGDGDSSKSSGQQSMPGNGDQESDSMSNESGSSPVSASGNQGKEAHNWENSKNEDKEMVQTLVQSVLDSMSSEKRGFIPASVMSIIKKLLEPPQVPWQEKLKQLVGTIPYPYRKTRMRLNRRQPFRADLSGRLPKRIVEIVCCFDTSGSMSDDDLKYCFTEVLNILQIYEGYSITIVECDAEVQKVYKCKSVRNFDTKAKGRGGTSFIPAINFINGEEPYKRNYPDLAGRYQNALMIYFTDGFGDSEIPKPRTYKNMWVVLNNEKNLSLKEPYGEVLSISTDPKWVKNHQR